MSNFENKKLVMIPTNENAGHKLNSTRNQLTLIDNKLFNPFKNEYYHLYILSDEKIKEGDWAVFLGGGDKWFVNKCDGSETQRQWVHKKIIATTDELLEGSGEGLDYLPEHIPQPSQSFIKVFVEEYNKGNFITEVLVEYEYNHLYPMVENDNLKLKINPKDNTVTISIK